MCWLDLTVCMQLEKELGSSRPLAIWEQPEIRLVELPAGSHYFIESMEQNPVENNSAIVDYFQIGKYSLRNASLLELFSQTCNESCFNQLRTIEQLGKASVAPNLVCGSCC